MARDQRRRHKNVPRGRRFVCCCAIFGGAEGCVPGDNPLQYALTTYHDGFRLSVLPGAGYGPTYLRWYGPT